MTRKTKSRPVSRNWSRSWRMALLAGALVLPLGPTLDQAVAQSGSSSHRMAARNPATGAQKIDLAIGKSLIFDLPRDAKEVFVANPKVANAVVRSARKLFIIGMADGATSIFAMDEEGRQIAALDIIVGRDLNVLRQTLRSAIPRARVDVTPAGDSILLTGEVASAAEAQQAMDIARAFVGQSGPPAAGATGAVINSLTIRGRDQVMIKVTVAEVSRQALKQLGVNGTFNWSIGSAHIGGGIDNPLSVARQILSNTDIGIGANGGGFSVRALERAGLWRTLAEPTLTAISGESAKFTAGGEIPVPKSETCTPSLVPGGAPVCTQQVEYKPVGVQLNFTPVVLSEGRISLRVATEVTEVDPENQLKFTNINVIGFRVRKADTTVEVPSGGSLVTAGLIQQTSRQAINGLPGLAHVPVLGALFRSRDYQRNESELLISVTPYIVRPTAPSQLRRPDEGFADAHDAQTLLLGRLNRIYGSGNAAAAQGYRGRVGFITD